LLAVSVAALVVSLGGVGAAGGAPTDLFISEYIEVSGQN
jgi:hypothetical protein